MCKRAVTIPYRVSLFPTNPSSPRRGECIVELDTDFHKCPKMTKIGNLRVTRTVRPLTVSYKGGRVPRRLEVARRGLI